MTPQEDRSAFNFEAKLSAERARLVGLCARLIGDVDAAEDLAQETLIEAWRHRERLYDPDGFSAWTSAIARNVCRRWERERGQQRVGNRHTNLDDITSPGYSDRAAADFDVDVSDFLVAPSLLAAPSEAVVPDSDDPALSFSRARLRVP